MHKLILFVACVLVTVLLLSRHTMTKAMLIKESS